MAYRASVGMGLLIRSIGIEGMVLVIVLASRTSTVFVGMVSAYSLSTSVASVAVPVFIRDIIAELVFLMFVLTD